MTKLGTYFRDMVECIDARLLCSSSAFGTYLLSFLYLTPSFSSSSPLPFFSSLLPITSCIALAIFGVFSRRHPATPAWKRPWLAGVVLAIVGLALFAAQGQTNAPLMIAATVVGWLFGPFFLIALMRRYAALAMRRRIAVTAASVVCSMTGLLLLAMLDKLFVSAAMVALPLIASASLPDPAKLLGATAVSSDTASESTCYKPSFLATVMLYGTLWALAQTIASSDTHLGGQLAFSAALSIVCIVTLSLFKGGRGSVEDANSAYKPAPLLIGVGLASIAWLPRSLTSLGSALVTAGFIVFFVYYWIVIGNHIQKFSWNNTRATVQALIPLLAGMASGRFAAALIVTLSPDPPGFIAVLGLLLLVLLLWMVTKGDLFANEPGQDVSVFKFRPPKPSAAAEHDEALDAFAQRFGISKREQEVALLLSKGRNVPFICDELFIAKSTVQTHIKHIYAKTGATNRQELLDIIELERPAQ